MKNKTDSTLTFALFDVITDLVCITDSSTKICYANPALRASYPKPLNESNHVFPWSDFPEANADTTNKIYSKLLCGWFMVTRQDISHLNWPNAHYMWTAVPEPDEIAKIQSLEGGLVGEWYKTLFETSPSGIILLDEKGIIIDANEAVSISSQYTRTQLLNQHISLLALPENHPSISTNIEKILTGITLNQEVTSRRKDGSFFYTLLSESAITLPNGRKGILSISNDISSYKKAEMALIESEREFRTIANYTANWEMWLDEEGNVKWTNPAVYRFTGYTPEHFLADPELLYKIVVKSFRNKVKAALQKALKGGKNKGIIFKYLNQEEEHWLSVTWTVIRDNNGVIQGLRSSGQDITGFMSEQQARSASDSLNQKLVDNAPFGMHFYTLDEKGDLIFTNFNPAANDILNIDHNLLIGKKLEDAFPSNRGTALMHHYREAATRNKVWHSEQLSYNDHIISGVFEVRAFQTEPGRMVAIFNDITSRKTAEIALHESRQLFEVLTRMAPVGIFRTNREGATTFVNPEWCALTGLSFEEGVQGKYLQAIHSDDRAERLREWEVAVKNASSVISEYRFVRPNGSVMWVQGQVVPEMVDNEVKGFIGTITDITEIIDSKHELLRAKEKAEASNRLKTTFMQNISHEIRTPLNGIFGFAQLLSSGEYTEEEKQEFMLFLDDSINRLTKTIDNIMEVSMLMSGNMQKSEVIFNLHDWINEIHQEFDKKATKKNIDLVLNDSINKNESLVIGDKGLLKRIVEEITDNAIKFTVKGSVTISCSLPGDELLLEISDTGNGIDQLFMPMLFEPFMQQNAFLPRIKNSGGIGLSIVKGIVDLLRGEVTVTSNISGGTTMLVKVPIKRLTNRRQQIKTVENTRAFNSEPLILLVEDEEINLLFIKRLLSKYPCRLLISENGHHAIEQVRQNPDIDLILMDIKLPGLGGYETVRKILQLRSDLKIAAVTAYSSAEDREACMTAGCIDFIAKPFHSKELFKLTKRIINWPFGDKQDNK